MRIIMKILLLIVFFFASGTASFAGSVQLTTIVSKPADSGGLPKTGQTILCQTGDDGDLKKGRPLSGPHYTADNVNNTITDNGTGLMWINNTSLAGVSGTYGWSGAITACEGLTYAGHSDWRLPNIAELQSIVNYGRSNLPTIGENDSPSPWVGTQSGNYWSSTTSISNTLVAWYVSFKFATVGFFAKAAGCYIRPVRGG
jgi:hypothetical protein